tara:strand:- start:456 stop:617 length:162 start_codon:yes stop_codon:yes gene_type:complete
MGETLTERSGDGEGTVTEVEDVDDEGIIDGAQGFKEGEPFDELRIFGEIIKGR